MIGELGNPRGDDDGPIRLDPVEAAVDQLGRGGMAVVVDSPNRENEGDLVMAADLVTPQAINFMATEARGLICVAMRAERLERLRIPPMAHRNGDPYGTAFHVAVDAAEGIGTGISAFDRARTIAALADPASGAEDLVRPGHVFPLAARDGGVFARAGHTEASLDLCALAELSEAAVICEIAADDGEMARLPELRAFADRHGLPLVTIADLIAHRRAERSRLVHFLDPDAAEVLL
jgi:3,4-dihydroxy 2-butanone 4-phosphate synthase/GTP cyclohydrolase II